MRVSFAVIKFRLKRGRDGSESIFDVVCLVCPFVLFWDPFVFVQLGLALFLFSLVSIEGIKQLNSVSADCICFCFSFIAPTASRLDVSFRLMFAWRDCVMHGQFGSERWTLSGSCISATGQH